MKNNVFSVPTVSKKIPGYQGSYVPMRDGLNELEQFFFNQELEICEKSLTKHVRKKAIRMAKRQNVVWTVKDLVRDFSIAFGFIATMITIIGLLSIWMV